jgi:hypothetical protein
MDQQLTRKNHYVPIWYQRRFLAEGKNKLHYLDIDPAKRELPDGRIVENRAVFILGPKSCFWTQDLYTTQFGEVLDDEIERYLFGKIDNEGAKAVRALSDNDPVGIHNSFQSFFEYLDAQKLRTPKGLDWIQMRYSNLTQLELMEEMQGLRLMHCIMWSEGVREIVSAEESDVKFIVTDHPVTIYNSACPPDSDVCAYPHDPLIEMIGSQTVFALDANHCLILTNLEYAENPNEANLMATRTNARYWGTGVVRTDAFIRTRKLTRDDVIGINCLLKQRARQYVAAGEREWLSPETQFSGNWADIGKILLPRDELWRFGGKIYVGYDDRPTYYQDTFGRTSGAHQYLRKNRDMTPPGRNDPCGCGSGRKYKKCCMNLPEQDRPSWTVYGIRERNLMFCRAVTGILGLDAGKTWEDVQHELSDEQVKRIHEAFGSLWPRDTDLAELLPRPCENTCRAVFLGTLDPRTIVGNATGWLLYFDELILPHPFVNPSFIRPEYSPVVSSAQHKEQTIKNVLLMLILEPYIDAGLVHLVPKPNDFNEAFRKIVWQIAEERTANWKPSDDDFGLSKKLAKDDFVRSIKRFPEPSLREYVRKHSPELSTSELDSVVVQMKSELAQDPLALLQPTEAGEAGAQLWIVKGFNLEVAMFLAGLTRSTIYTDMRVHWDHLHARSRLTESLKPDVTWQPLIDAAKTIIFPINLEGHSGLETRMAGKFGGMRTQIRRITNTVRDNVRDTSANQLADEFKKAAESMQTERSTTTTEMILDGHLEFSIPSGGFERNAVRRLLLTFGRAKDIAPIPLAFFVRVAAHLEHSAE